MIITSMMQTCHYTNLTFHPQEHMSTSVSMRNYSPTVKFSGMTKTLICLWLWFLMKLEWMEMIDTSKWLLGVPWIVFYHQKLISGVSGDDCNPVSSQRIVKFTFDMLMVNRKSFFRSQKDLKLIFLWASISLELWLAIYFIHQKSECWVTGDGCLMFPAKSWLYSLSICFWSMKNYFQKWKITQTHLLMVFSNIRNMAGYIL